MVFSAVVKKASRVGAFFVSALLAAELAAQCPAPGSTQAVRVTRVVDGDTLHLADGRKARLIGLNAPELGRRGQAAQPFARPALLQSKAGDLNYSGKGIARHGVVSVSTRRSRVRNRATGGRG